MKSGADRPPAEDQGAGDAAMQRVAAHPHDAGSDHTLGEAGLDASLGDDKPPAVDSVDSPPGAPGGEASPTCGLANIAITSDVQCTLGPANWVGRHADTTTQYIPAVWLLPGPTSDTVLVVTQTTSDQTGFKLYQANLFDTATAATESNVAGMSDGGVQLLDVGSDRWGPFALTTFRAGVAPGGGPLSALARVPLLDAGPALVVSAAFPGGTPSFARIASGTSYWAATVEIESGAGYGLYLGEGAAEAEGGSGAGRQVMLDGQQIPYLPSRVTPLVLGNRVYVFYDEGTPGAATTVYSASSDLRDVDAATIAVADQVVEACGLATTGHVLAARPSDADGSNAAVLAAIVAPESAVQLWGGTVSPEVLGLPLTLGAGPPLSPGSVLPSDEMPPRIFGYAWDKGDHLAILDNRAIVDGGGNALELLWLAPDGHAVFHGPLKPTTGGIIAAAVQFRSRSQQTQAAFDIAWIERWWPCTAPAICDPNPFEVLFAATVTCGAADGGR